MKYIVSVNGSRYEVEVQRLSPFRMLTREEAAAGPAAPASPVSPPPRQAAEPAPRQAAPPPPAPPAPAAEPAPAPSGPASRSVTAPLPGTVLDIRVAVGQAVKAGQIVAAMEAMKMEHEIPSSEDGTVAQILVNKGDVVETGAVLIQLL